MGPNASCLWILISFLRTKIPILLLLYRGDCRVGRDLVVVVHNLFLSNADLSMVSSRFANQLSNKLDGALGRLSAFTRAMCTTKTKTRAQATTFRQK